MNWIDYVLLAWLVCGAGGAAYWFFYMRPKALKAKAQAGAQSPALRAQAASHEAEHMKAAAAIHHETGHVAGAPEVPSVKPVDPAAPHTYEVLKQHPDGSLKPTGEKVPADQNPHAHATAKSVETGVPHVVRRV